MGVISKLKERAKEAKMERVMTRRFKEETRKKAKIASLESERIESVKVAQQRGRERARRPSGMAAFSAGLQTLSKNVDKIAPSRKQKKGKSMLDMKFF